MPIYEYRCLQCGRNFDLFHAVGADPGPCPWCRGTVRRIYSSIGVIFKGSGFHSTDYRKTPKDEGAPKEAPGDRPSAPSKGTGSESKGTGSESKVIGSESTKSSAADAKTS